MASLQVARPEDAPAAKMNAPFPRMLLLVVLFETPPSRSATLRSLALQDDPAFDLVIWDNSPAACAEAERAFLSRTFPRCEYRHCGHNTPLARLYDTVIREKIKLTRCCDYLVLFDQDSTLPTGFITAIREAAAKHPDIGMLLPLVTSTGRLVSPATIRLFLGRRWKSAKTGLLPSRSITAINSGMTLSARYLETDFDGYPEDLAFYGTDSWMCQAYAEHAPTVLVVDTTIQHGLAEHQSEPIEKRLWRHREIVRSTRFLNRRGLLRRCACDLYLVIFSARKARKFRDSRFLRWI